MDAAARAALARCVGDVDAFVGGAWGRRPVHHPGGEGFEDLLSLSDVDLMLSTMALRVPMFRLVKDGGTIPSSRYTRTGRTGSTTMAGLADPPRLFRLFEQGATIVLQGMQRFWLPLARLCRELEIALGHPTQVNAYVTPSGSTGLAVHEDTHDVFVLQAFGRKHWEVYERRPGSRGGRVDDPGDPVLSVVLEPGHCLYLPKGTPHAARTQETLSGHLTIGILSITWRGVLRTVLERLTDDPQFEEPLPAGYHLDEQDFADEIGRRLEELQRRLEKVDAVEVAERRVRSFLTSRPAILRGGLEDVVRIGDLADTSRVRRRPASILEVRVRGDRLVAYLGDRELVMPKWVEPAVRWIADAGEFEVRELAPHIDAESRVVLVRRLVREGVLEVVG